MSLARRITNLIAGVTDPMVRMDIASTINYLFSIYADGTAPEDRIRDALYEILMDVLTATKPELTIEEIRDKARILVDEFMSAFKLESLSRRIRTRYRIRPPI